MIRRARGFTLVEVLVASAIFAALSVLAYGGMDHVFKNKTALEKKNSELEKLQLAFSIMKNDLELAVNRSIRDYRGDVEAAFASPPKNENKKLAFTTHIRSAVQFEQAISALLRVEYRLEEKQLFRYRWPVLDRAHDTEPEKTLLLDDVEDIEYQFVNQQSYDYWPLPRDQEDSTELPRAVKLKISLHDTHVERLFLVREI